MTQELDYSMLNIDYNNIHSGEQLQKIIHELKAIIEYKIKHINELTSIHDKEQEEREIVLRRMTETNSLNAHKIEQYKGLIYSISEDYSRFIKDSEEDKQKQRKSIEALHQLQTQQINKKIQELEADYKKLKEFEDLQADYLTKIELISRDNINQQYQQNDGLNKEEALQMKENRDLETHLDQQIHITQKTAPSHAINKITTELQTNQQQNTHLKQKLYQLQAELQKLKKQRFEILNKRNQLKINVTLNEEELQEYKAVGSLQKTKIKAYKDKLQNLKQAISQEVAKKEKSLTEHKKEREANLKTLKLKLFNIEKEKEELKIKTEKMNLLGQTILQQRTEIEEFFIMALDSCKKEIEGMERGRGHVDEKEQKSYGEKVDIEELLPKDKQRILTNLYTKLAFGMK